MIAFTIQAEKKTGVRPYISKTTEDEKKYFSLYKGKNRGGGRKIFLFIKDERVAPSLYHLVRSRAVHRAG